MENSFWVQLLDMVEYTDYIATFATPGRNIVDIEPWTYVVDDNAAAITQTVAASYTTQMDGDNDFVLTYMSGFGRATGSQEMLANPAIMVQIADLTTGRTFFSDKAPMPMIAGQGGFPFLLNGPKVIRARSALRLTAQSAQVQTFTGFYFCYHGARIWYG